MFRKIAFLAMALLVSGSAFAQDYSRGEVAVGWSVLRDFDIDETFPEGFHVGGAVNVTSWLGIAGDVGYNTKNFSDDFDLADVDLSVTTYAAGPRFNGRFGKSTGFGHVLFGGARFSAAGSILGVTDSASDTQFLIQPGGGVDIGMSESVAIRAQGDYLYVKDSDGEFRFVLGVVFRFGR